MQGRPRTMDDETRRELTELAALCGTKESEMIKIMVHTGLEVARKLRRNNILSYDATRLRLIEKLHNLTSST